MDNKEIKTLLKPYGLKLTLPRLKILEIMFTRNRGVPYTELLNLTKQFFDRATLYRTLKSFEEMELIHRIVSTKDSSIYALSIRPTGPNNSEVEHISQYLHFSCIKCHLIYCLSEQIIPRVVLPEQYEVYTLNMTMEGICRDCSIKKN